MNSAQTHADRCYVLPPPFPFLSLSLLRGQVPLKVDEATVPSFSAISEPKSSLGPSPGGVSEQALAGARTPAFRSKPVMSSAQLHMHVEASSHHSTFEEACSCIKRSCHAGGSRAHFQGMRPRPSQHLLSSSAPQRGIVRADHSPKP